MSAEIIVKFTSIGEGATGPAELAQRVESIDLTRIGIVAGASDDGLSVIVEPDIDGWDGVRPEVACEILRSGMAACGVWAEVRPRDTEGDPS